MVEGARSQDVRDMFYLQKALRTLQLWPSPGLLHQVTRRPSSCVDRKCLGPEAAVRDPAPGVGVLWLLSPLASSIGGSPTAPTRNS